MSDHCLHCRILDAIQDVARETKGVVNGVVVCDRSIVLSHLSVVLSEILYSEPDLVVRAALVEEVCFELREVAKMPGSAQPRENIEVVPWQ